MCACAFSIETNAHRCLTDVQVTNEHLRKPLRQMGVQKQQIRWGKGIESQHSLQDREYARRRPCLGPIRFRIERWERMLIIPHMTAEALGKAVVIEERAGFENCTGDGLKFLDQTETHHAHCKASVLYGPDRAPVVAIWVVGRVLGRKRSDSPTAEHVIT